MKLNEITERLQKIKSDIEDAFEKELIDFDEIHSELSSIIDTMKTCNRAAIPGRGAALNIENYI